MRFARSAPRRGHQLTAFPAKECFDTPVARLAELLFCCGGNQVQFLSSVTFVTKMNPGLTKQSYYKSSAATHAFIWRTEAKQSSQFVFFHLYYSWLFTYNIHDLSPILFVTFHLQYSWPFTYVIRDLSPILFMTRATMGLGLITNICFAFRVSVANVGIW